MAHSRSWWQLVALAALQAMGCGIVNRPYANDPILREREAVWGDLARSRGSVNTHHSEPAAPQAPSIPTPLPKEWLITEPITSP